MNLINVLASDISSVYALVKSYLMNPIVAGVPIQCYEYRSSETAEVSKHVLVNLSGGKQFVNDNVAPGPHVWSLEGYVGGLPVELVGRPELMPSLRYFHYMLESAYASRSTIIFIDADLNPWPVAAIEDLEFRKDPVVQNREIVRVTVRELTLLAVNVFPTDQVTQAANPVAGAETGSTAGTASPAVISGAPTITSPGPSRDFVGQLGAA